MTSLDAATVLFFVTTVLSGLAFGLIQLGLRHFRRSRMIFDLGG